MIKFCCCSYADRTTEYITETKLKGPLIRAACFDVCKNCCLINCLSCCGICNCCVTGFDFQLSIEDENGNKTGYINLYFGCCSQKVERKNCYCPRPYFEIFMPQNANSEQKFQIIADAIHFDLQTNVL